MSVQLSIPYSPHPKQLDVHNHPARFKVVAAGRRAGKTTLAINELLRHALMFPQRDNLTTQRSWYVAATYKMAETIAWREFFRYCPAELIANKQVNKLTVELINGHLIEFKGGEDPDKLRGVSLRFVILDEYGIMKEEIWEEILRPALVDCEGEALFIGTPGANGSPHFEKLYKRGLLELDGYKSWLFFTRDNPINKPEEIERARREMDPDVFKREFEADFSSTAGLIYDNFKHPVHVIPNYEPQADDLVIGSIDPGLHNPTGALLVAWDKDGVGRVFKEYYQKGKLATENALAIKKMSDPYKVSYWVIDRSAEKRDPSSGLTVAGKYREVLRPRPVIAAANDPNSVWAGIDEVKNLLHVDPNTGGCRLYVTAQMTWFLWEIGRYIAYKHKHFVDRNDEEKPRKLHDHLMDCIRNMVMTRPWLRRNLQAIARRNVPHNGSFY